MTFNINDNVKVRLTEHGHEILRKQYDEAVKRCPALKSMLFERYKADAEGWSEFALWDLMARFGGHTFNGCTLPFDLIIRIEHSDVSDNDE